MAALTSTAEGGEQLPAALRNVWVGAGGGLRKVPRCAPGPRKPSRASSPCPQDPPQRGGPVPHLPGYAAPTHSCVQMGMLCQARWGAPGPLGWQFQLLRLRYKNACFPVCHDSKKVVSLKVCCRDYASQALCLCPGSLWSSFYPRTKGGGHWEEARVPHCATTTDEDCCWLNQGS